ncbi:unnamed protein product [Auanema sp. JU1783]|nr:unnamed protein product [Auanema sp. JU1783]
MFLDSNQLQGVILVKDSSSCFGEPIVYSLTKQNKVVVVTLKGRKDQLINRYACRVDENSFVYFDDFSRLSVLKENILKSSSNNGLCVIDCIEILLDIYGVDSVAMLMNDLKDYFMVVAAFCHYQTVSLNQWNRLCSIADSFLDVYKEGSLFLSNITSIKKNGKLQALQESFTVSPDLQLNCKKYECKEESSDNLSLETPFDVGLTLKDSEKSAKDALQLPYLSTQTQEGLVNLRLSDKKVRVGGQIIYTPDDGDDLDDSDPDDDLNL